MAQEATRFSPHSFLSFQNTKLNIGGIGEERLLPSGFLKEKPSEMIAYRRITVFSLNELRLELSKSIYGHSGHKHSFSCSDQQSFFFLHHSQRSDIKSSNNHFLIGGKRKYRGSLKCPVNDF